MQTCKLCQETVPLSDFPKSRRGYRSVCTRCTDWRKRIRSSPKASWPYRSRHVLVYCRVCQLPKPRTEFYVVPSRVTGVRPECKLCRNLQARSEKYGISEREFLEMLGAQNHQCAICSAYIDEFTACVDHCHATGKIRGLLDRTCNLALGHFDDDPARMRMAITYLGG